MSVKRLRLVGPGNGKGVVLELDVFHRRFHQVGGDFLAFGDNLVHGLHHGGTADREAAAAVGAHAEWNFSGIAVHDLNLVERDAELADDKLGEGGLVALAVAVGAGEDR